MILPDEDSSFFAAESMEWKLKQSYTVITGFTATATGKPDEEGNATDDVAISHEGKPIEIMVSESGAMAGLLATATAVLALYAF